LGPEQLDYSTLDSNTIMISGFVVLLALAPHVLSVPVADPVADADPSAYASGYNHYLPVGAGYEALPSSQFHSQDDIGSYQFGFESADQTKSEVKSADGVVRGSYSYIDANGIVQTTNYISDALGFRVAATNLPVHHVEGAAPAVVEALPAAAPVEAIAPTYNQAMVPSVPYSYLPYATNYGYQGYAIPSVHAAPVAYQNVAPVVHAAYAPVVYADPAPVVNAAASPVVQDVAPVVQAAYAPVVYADPAPVVNDAASPVVQDVAQVVQAVYAPVVYAAAPAVQPTVTGSQYHAQDEAGSYSFGYQDTNSVRQETKTADGTVSGEYQYVDSDGLIQAVQYIADEAGFRVAGTNLPVFAAAVPVDTPEVAAAKIQHAQAFAAVEANALQANAAAYAAHPNGAQFPVITYVAQAVAALIPVPALQAPEDDVDLIPDLAEDFIGAAKFYAAPVVTPALSSEESEALAQGYYGAVPAPAPLVYNTPAIVPGIHAAPVAVASASPVAIASADPVFVAPQAAGYQYHSQDDFGQYSFGYQDGNSGKQEIKTADGVVRGSYSYVDSDGIVQTVNYIADALGFRVGATNLPVHHVEGAAAAVVAPVTNAVEPVPQAAYVASAPAMTPQVAYSYLPYAVNYGYHNYPSVAAAHVAVAQAAPVAFPQEAPVDFPQESLAALAQTDPVAVEKAALVSVVNAAPVAVAHSAPVALAHTAPVAVPIVASPVGEVNSQYHAQDEAGSYSYGFNSATQAKTEVKSADGVTRGSYSYVDPNGLVQTVNYISDAMGFRVAATNLPIHDVAQHGVAEASIDESAVVEAVKYSGLTPNVDYAYLPYATNYGYVNAAPSAAIAA